MFTARREILSGECGVFVRRRIDRIVADTTYVLVASVALLVGLELSCRVIRSQEHQDRGEDKGDHPRAYSYFEWKEQFQRDFRGFHALPLQYEPYSLWRSSDYSSPTINVIDGYRETWQAPGSGDGSATCEIWTFGGSTLMGADSPDDNTIPSYLARSLANNAGGAGRTYLVRNFGVSGFVSENEIHLLVKLLRESVPDVVIFYDGVNDILNKVARGRPHYLYDNFAKLGRRDRIRDLLAEVARRLAIVRSLMEPASFREADMAWPSEVFDRRAEQLLDSYSAGLDLVARLGDSYGFDAYHFRQPNIFTTNKKLTEEEQAARQEFEYLAPAYEAFQTASSSGGAPRLNVYDLSDALDNVQESIFLDYCHVTAIGNKAVVDRMLERVDIGCGIE